MQLLIDGVQKLITMERLMETGQTRRISNLLQAVDRNAVTFLEMEPMLTTPSHESLSDVELEEPSNYHGAATYPVQRPQ